MKNKLFSEIAALNKNRANEEFTVEEYLNLCKKDKMAYATAAERMLAAIGEPEIVDTSKDSRLKIIFQGRKIKVYPAFKQFYGIELDIEAIVGFFKHAAQGLEESKQILFLLGDVGSGKSTMADVLKKLMEVYPIYVLAAEDGTISPVNDNPLGLFIEHLSLLKDEYGISSRYLPKTLSPWALKRLNHDYKGDITKFKVIKVYPSYTNQVAIAKTEPLDDNNADIGVLIGKVNMRQLQWFSQNDPDAYNFSGALCKGNRGITEMAEMYKANIKTLNPLLEASQSHTFNGLEQIGAIPFDGIIISHSNKSEWAKFKGDKKNEALLDRIFLVKIHYALRWEEEVKIYQKMLQDSDLADKPIAAKTLEILAKWSVLTRLEEIENSNLNSKLRVYNGENIKNEDNRALPYAVYRDKATQDEGLSGSGVRNAFKLLAAVYNHYTEEVSADPKTLFFLLSQQIVKDQLGDELQKKYLGFIDEWLEPKYVEFLGDQIQTAYIENNHYAQSVFDRYYALASAWVEDSDYPDPLTGVNLDRDKINKELSIIEKAAAIGDPKDFRGEIVHYILKRKAEGVHVRWDSYKKLSEVIQKSVFKNMKDLLPIISFSDKENGEDELAHKKFVDNMVKMGYTVFQVKNLVTYYMEKQHS